MREGVPEATVDPHGDVSGGPHLSGVAVVVHQLQLSELINSLRLETPCVHTHTHTQSLRWMEEAGCRHRCALGKGASDSRRSLTVSLHEHFPAGLAVSVRSREQGMLGDGRWGVGDDVVIFSSQLVVLRRPHLPVMMNRYDNPGGFSATIRSASERSSPVCSPLPLGLPGDGDSCSHSVGGLIVCVSVGDTGELRVLL